MRNFLKHIQRDFISIEKIQNSYVLSHISVSKYLVMAFYLQKQHPALNSLVYEQAPSYKGVIVEKLPTTGNYELSFVFQKIKVQWLVR